MKDWLKWYEIWMENPLVTVDASQIESLVGEMFKSMTRCMKIFSDHPREFII